MLILKELDSLREIGPGSRESFGSRLGKEEAHAATAKLATEEKAGARLPPKRMIT